MTCTPLKRRSGHGTGQQVLIERKLVNQPVCLARLHRKSGDFAFQG